LTGETWFFATFLAWERAGGKRESR